MACSVAWTCGWFWRFGGQFLRFGCEDFGLGLRVGMVVRGVETKDLAALVLLVILHLV